MKEFEKSIKKTIANIEIIVETEKDAIRVLEFHEDQFISQEEEMTFSKSNRCSKLWNVLLDLIGKKYPQLVEL